MHVTALRAAGDRQAAMPRSRATASAPKVGGMPRLVAMAAIAALLGIAKTTEAASQAARCRLAPRPYGFGGLCRLQQPEGAPTQPLRIRLPDSVRIWTTAGPQDQPPWRGNMSLPSTEVAFEIAPAGRDSGRLVLRTGVFWLPVTEWRLLDSTQASCAACERLAKDVLLVLDLVHPPAATDDDISILRSAWAGLDRVTSWNRQEAQVCPSLDLANTGLFCLLYGAVERRMGRYHHRQPALELVRAVIAERWRERITSHQLVDFNNHPATTMADLRIVLQVALERATAQAQSRQD